MEDPLLKYNTKNNPKTGGILVGGLLVESLQVIIYALAMSVVIYLFIAIPNQVEGLSMHPNLDSGDILLTNKFIQIGGGKENLIESYDYERGDMVVFKQPNRPDLVKRIVGMPGESFKIENGRVYIDGQVLIEDYLPEDVATEPGRFLQEGREKTIPPDSYVVLGDNRSNSRDSRTLEVGFVKREHFKGRPFLRILPLDNASLIRTGEYRFSNDT